MFWTSLLLLFTSVVESANVCTYEGGWSLRVDANFCPINAPVNCGPGIQLRCCPNGLTCTGEGDFGGNWCCKEGEDCKSQASASPKVSQSHLSSQCASERCRRDPGGE
ncbi:hypothetical protein PG994_003008 [Apiospora phragmitis]|uniref:Uncharacterized protein n=1 Tax=Apiospora phragmitis TaxID=2905665 RepID=A0ABR1W6U4_9PEZI